MEVNGYSFLPAGLSPTVLPKLACRTQLAWRSDNNFGQRQASNRRNLSCLRAAVRYLAEFAYRFNRRYQLADLVPRLDYVAVRTPPLPYRLLTLAGTAG